MDESTGIEIWTMTSTSKGDVARLGKTFFELYYAAYDMGRNQMALVPNIYRDVEKFG